jgi:hypothetical protein
MSTTSLWEDGQLPGLNGLKQAGTALRLARAHLLPMLAIWVAMSLYAWGQGYLVRTFDLATAPGLSARYLGFTLASGIVSAVLSAITFRILLGRRPALAFDGGVLTYIGIMTVVALVPPVLMKLVVGGPPTDTADTQAMMAYGVRSLGVGLALIVAALACLKLMLWPIGLAVGDREVTPGVSWKLTHRAYWGYIIGVFLLAIVPYIAMTVIIMNGVRAAGGGAAAAAGNISPLAAPFTALFALAFTVTAAALYHLRLGAEGDPAGVFD